MINPSDVAINLSFRPANRDFIARLPTAWASRYEIWCIDLRFGISTWPRGKPSYALECLLRRIILRTPSPSSFALSENPPKGYSAMRRLGLRSTGNASRLSSNGRLIDAANGSVERGVELGIGLVLR